MSRPEFGSSADLALSVAGVEATPGQPCRIAVTVTNTGESPTAVSLAVIGIDESWVHVPDPVGPLAAGQSTSADIVVTVPLGHPPARLTASVMARDDRGLGRAADVSIEVLDGSVVAASVEPPEARGGWRGRADVVLRNRGRVPVRVDLDSSSPDAELRVRISHGTQVLEAGQQVRVTTRFNAPRPVAGGGRRRPYAVRVRTSGTPLYVEGAFTQRAMLPPWISKGVAVALVVALWVAVAVVGISSLGHHLNKSATQKAANNNPPAAAPSAPSAGGSGGSGGGGANGSGGGAGGAGGSGGAAGSGSGSAAGGGASGTGSGSTSPSRLSGKVAASQPGGVTVTVTPTSLADAAAQTASLTASVTRDAGIELASASLPMGKIYGDALPAPMAVPPARSGPEALQTTTAADGSWAIAAITSPGYYLVSFSKPGYATAGYVVNVAGNGQPVTVQSRLVPGDGYLSGTVNGPSGPLGGALITITDGTLNLTTRTPTVGATGTWSVHGLSTPDTYLVTVTLPGYSTQTTLQTLGAGDGQGAVNFTMVPGQGSVEGTAVSSRSGQPVGGLSVTVSGASVSRTTTTTTSGAVGAYSLPDLPVPGTYALTISGPGYVTQTQQVSLQSTANSGNATVNATVTPSAADVTGVATSSTGQGLAGAGAVLSNQQNTFKTLTTSGGTVGSFDFGQVPPGQYVLSVTDYGYTTQSAQVSVGPGQVQTVNLSLSPVPSQSIATATVQGSVQSLATSKAIVGAQIQLDGKDTSVTTNTNGSYSIPNVGPGTHTVTALCPTATTCQSADSISNKLGPGAFETTSVQATVALGSLSFASPILMPKLDQLSGIVIDGSGARVANPVVTLTDPQTHTNYPANPSPAVAPASQGGFEFDALPHGTYTLTVSKGTTSAAGTCGDSGIYETYTQSITMAIDTDTALTGPAGSTNASPVLTIEPTYRVNTEYIPASGGGPQPTSGPVTVTVTGAAGTPSAGFTATCKETSSQTVVVLPNSAQGAKFDVAFSYTDSSGVVYNAPGTAVTDQVNSATVDTVVLVPDISNDVLVTLSFPWRTPAGIVNCTVSVTPEPGCPTLTKNDLPTTVTLGGQVTSPGGAIGPAAQPFTGSDQGGGVWKFPATSLVGLVPGTVTFGTQGGAFQQLSFPTTTAAANFSNEKFTLTPNGTEVSGTLSSPTSGTSISVAPTQAGLSVTVSPGSSNNIAWQESGRAAQQISPGIYNITFSHSSYDSVVVSNFAVNLCDAGKACSITLGTGGTPTVTAGTDTYAPGNASIALIAQFSFSVTPTEAETRLAYPTVTVTNGSGAVVGSATYSASLSTATFPDLSVTQAPYTITITDPAFQTYTATYVTSGTGIPLTVSTTPSTVDVTPTLTLEGYIVGTVKGKIGTSPSDLLGATVTATFVSAPVGCTSGATPNQLKGSTGSDGSFTLINQSASDGGVCSGSVYNVVVTDDGYADSTTFPVTIIPGANQAAVDPVNHDPVPIEITASQIKVTFTVTKGVGGAGVGGVTVTGTSLIGRPAAPPTPSTPPTPNTTAADGTISLEVDPTKYTFTFTESGYAPLSEVIDYSVGEADQTTSIALSFDLNTVQGVVSTPGSCASGGSTVTPCPLGGAAVTLTNSTTGQAFTATSSATDGSFSFAPPSLSIADGTYQLQASLSGYQYSSGYQPSFATSSSLTTIKNVSLAPSPVRVTVTANSNFSGLNLVGDAVSLSPATPPSAQTCPGGSAPLGEGSSQTAQIAAGGQASISNVTPDYYDVTVVAGNLPTQPPTGLLVCPGTATSGTYSVAVGQITGTVVAPAASGADQASAFTITVTPGTPAAPTGTAQSLVVTCSTTPSGCTKGTYTSGYLTPGSYTVQAADGSSYTMPSEQVTAGSSGPTTAGTLTAGLTPVTVIITVKGNKPDNSGLSVTLLDAGSPVGTHSTDSGGAATFPSVTPDPGASFTVTVDDGGTALAQSSPLTFSIGIGSGNISETVTVTPKPPPTTTTTTTTTTVAPTTTTTGSTTTTTTAPITTTT